MNPIGILLPFFAGMAVLWVLSRLILQEAGGSRQARVLPDGGLEFASEPSAFVAMYLFIGILALFGGAGGISALVTGRGMAPALFCLAFVALLLRVLPGTIVLTDQGLEQRYWLLKVMRIGWDEVREVIVDAKQGKVTVHSKFGGKIVHMRQLADRARLLAELEARCPDKMPGAKRRFVVAPPPELTAS